MLAARLSPKYRYENCAVVALNDGGVVIGAQIASELHCVLTMLTSAEIKLPREPDAIAGITASGIFTYNPKYSDGEISELAGENRGFIEQEKLHQMHELNLLIGGTGTIHRDLIQDHMVIVVSDGFPSAFEIDLAYQFLKPIRLEKLVFAVPFAAVSAVDRMHVLADDLYCLNVLENYHETDHYYDTKDVPDHATVLKTIQEIILNWR